MLSFRGRALTRHRGIVDQNVQGLLLLVDPAGEGPDRVQGRRVYHVQMNISVACQPSDLFHRGVTQMLALARQDNTGASPRKVQRDKLPNPCSRRDGYIVQVRGQRGYLGRRDVI